MGDYRRKAMVDKKELLTVNERLVIKTDGLNWVVYERKTNEDENSENFGKEYLTNPAYYGKIEHMAAYLLRQVEGEVEGATLIEQLKSLIKLVKENTKSITTGLEAALKK